MEARFERANEGPRARHTAEICSCVVVMHRGVLILLHLLFNQNAACGSSLSNMRISSSVGRDSRTSGWASPQEQQTPHQKQRMAQLDQAAAHASASATARLLEMLGAPGLREALRTVGAQELAALEPLELLTRWRAEMAVAEIAHGFDTSPNFDDVDLAQASNLSFFPNQWQLEVIYPRDVHNRTNQQGRYGADGFIGTMAAAAATETSLALYGLSNFTGSPPSLPGWGPAPAPVVPFVPGGFPRSMAEASERLVYGVLNSHRLDFPCAYWGNVALVFNRSAVSPLLTLSPMDTGDYAAACPSVVSNFSGQFCSSWSAARCDFWLCRPDATSGGCVPGSRSSVCDVWANTTLGTDAHFDHILPAWAAWHGDQANNVLALMLARMLQSWWPGSTAAPTNATRATAVEFYPNFTQAGGNFDYYHEANLVGTPLYGEGTVKFLLVQFAQHFGASSGLALRQWAAARRWPLVWTWGVGDRPLLSIPDSWSSTLRVLDPSALLSSGRAKNISSHALAAGPQWRAVWAEVQEARRATGGGLPADQLRRRWEELYSAAPTALVIEPLRASSCSSPHECFGLDREAHCVC